MTYQPNAKMVRYAMSLGERKIGFTEGNRETARNNLWEMTGPEVSALITRLKAMPDVNVPEPVTEGMYRNPETGEIFKVQVAVHGSGQLYAKRLVKLDAPKTMRGKEYTHEFQYAGGAAFHVRAEWKMTKEAAMEWGKLYGACCRCGAVLTDDSPGGSIENGIGPVCAGKF